MLRLASKLALIKTTFGQPTLNIHPETLEPMEEVILDPRGKRFPLMHKGQQYYIIPVSSILAWRKDE